MTIYIGADHGGYALKEKVKTWLDEWKYDYTDEGALHLDPEDDYPDFAFAVAEAVSHDSQGQGILICRSAAGMIIAANKVMGIRAVAVFDDVSTKHAREHNNANIIGLSGDWLDEEKAKQIVKTFLTTEFTKEERHQRRIDKISEMEEGGGCGGCGGGACGGGCC